MRSRWEHWQDHAACRGCDPEELFGDSPTQKRVRTLCTGCPVRTECLAEALDNRIEFDVWGGMTERERRALLRRRPDVASWWKVLDDARHGPEQQQAG